MDIRSRISAGPGLSRRTPTEPLVTLTARISGLLWRRVRIHCARGELAIQSFVTDAAREYLRVHRRRR